MCQVRCRHYECGHWFHENVKPCAYFNNILDNAHKNPALLKAQRCTNHGATNKISRCKDVKEVCKMDTSIMFRIDDIEGPWSVARRKIVGGHCATKELRFLPSNNPGGPSKYATLKGSCKECTDEVEKREAAEKKRFLPSIPKMRLWK